MTAFLAGSDVEQADVAALRLQGNTAWGGCGSPWAMASVRCTTGTHAEAEIPAMPGVRRVTVLGVFNKHSFDTETVKFTLTDDTGALGSVTKTYAGSAGARTFSDDIEWTRDQDGPIVIKLAFVTYYDILVSFCIAPKPPTISSSGMEGDGYIHTDRTLEDAGPATRFWNLLYDQIYNGWRRPQVYKTFFDVGGARQLTGTASFATTLPVLSRGHKLGISVQAAYVGSGTPTVTLVTDHGSAEASGFPAAQGTIETAETADTIPAGYITADIQVYVPAGGVLDVYSISVYEVI